MSLAQLRALGESKIALSLSFHKERAKERKPKAAAFGNCAVRRSEKRTAEKQSSSKLLHLGRISARPRWVRRAKAFTVSFLFQLSSITGREAGAKAFSRKQSPCNFHVCKFFELANAKAEAAHFCVVLRDLSRPQRRTAGCQGVLNPLARFFVLFVAGQKGQVPPPPRVVRRQTKGEVVKDLAKLFTPL